MKGFFERVDDGYSGMLHVNAMGETMAQLHERASHVMELLIADAERHNAKCMLLCT